MVENIKRKTSRHLILATPNLARLTIKIPDYKVEVKTEIRSVKSNL